MVKGGDESGALSEIYQRLSEADTTVYEATGLADINSGYGVILHIKPDDSDRAVASCARIGDWETFLLWAA